MKKRRITRIILFSFLLIAFGASCFLVFQPWLMREGSRRKAASDADAFLQHYEPSSTLPDTAGATSEPTTAAEELPRGELYEAMQAYNTKIAAEGQEGLCDPWAYTVPAIDLSAYGLDADEAIAVLQIPSINVRLPIYSGASIEHLNKGAALLSQTSSEARQTGTVNTLLRLFTTLSRMTGQQQALRRQLGRSRDASLEAKKDRRAAKSLGSEENQEYE